MGNPETNRPEPIRVRVGGRAFSTAAKTTLKQDMHIWGALVDADMSDIVAHFDPEKGDFDEVGTQIVLHAYHSGALFKIVAATMVEDGVRWTPAEAEKNAAFFEDLTEDEDKAAIRGPMIGVLLSFFMNGVVSRINSPKSSESNSESPTLTSPAPFAEMKTSESGMASSENSLDTAPMSMSES